MKVNIVPKAEDTLNVFFNGKFPKIIELYSGVKWKIDTSKYISLNLNPT